MCLLVFMIIGFDIFGKNNTFAAKPAMQITITRFSKLFWGDQELLGVGLDFAFGVCRTAKQGYETLEQTVFLKSK